MKIYFHFYVSELKYLGSSLPVPGLGEMVNSRRFLELPTEDGPLLPQPNTAGRGGKAGGFDQLYEISLGLDVLPNAEVLRPFLKQRIHHFFDLLLLHDSRVQAMFFPLAFFLWVSCSAASDCL